jgi:DNA-binding NtrC family response regulator
MDASRERILIVDDEENLLPLFQRILQKEGYEVECASSGEEGLNKLGREWFDLVISDLSMPGMDGLELLKKGKATNPALPFIMLTGHGAVGTAVTAMKDGAYHYLIKPVDSQELKLVVKKALELHRLTREVERLRSQLELDLDLERIVGRSREMRAIFRTITLVARSNATILLQGEPGTGKKLLARALHQHSRRNHRPFFSIHCASLPEILLESELFGHICGAFTGATNNKKGLFEEAHEGTLLLDQIEDTSAAFQSQLLRILQQGAIRPLGTDKSIKIDVRIIAGTNKNLNQEVEKKSFREDLFHRLSVVRIMIPPLRDRREDIPLLVNHFVNKYAKQHGLEPKKIPPKALSLLLDHSWPGNVRELQNLIERAVLIHPGPELSPEVLFPGQMIKDESAASLRQATKGVT